MIKKVEMYSIICDNCGGTYIDEDRTGFSAWANKGYAIEASDDDGWEMVGDKNYCPGCHKFDDNDKLIINPSTKGL